MNESQNLTWSTQGTSDNNESKQAGRTPEDSLRHRDVLEWTGQGAGVNPIDNLWRDLE